MTPAQVDHVMVRRHEVEVIEENFTRWVMAFGCIVCVLIPVSLGLLMFLIYSYATERHKECDVPMNLWFIVVIINIVYNINLNGKSIHRQVIRVICRYEAFGHRLEPPPPRVRIYHLLVTCFVFGWHCVGLHWIRTSSTCNATAPNMYRAVYLFATFNVVFTIFTTVSTFGLSHMLASLMRRGLLPAAMLHPDRVAPEGTLEMQETVSFDPEAFGEALQCPTCLEDFGKEQTIKKTVCGHLFHEDCLAPWLRVNRTCPLCRSDLARGLEAPPEAIGAPTSSASTQTDEDATAPASTVVTINGRSPRSSPIEASGRGNSGDTQADTGTSELAEPHP